MILVTANVVSVPIRPRRLTAFLAAALTAGTASACGSPAAQTADDDGKLTVVAAFYPLEHAVEQVGGDLVSVTNLTKPGAEPHDVELTPRDIATVSTADLAVYEQGVQPALDQAVADEAIEGAYDVSGTADLTRTFDPAVDVSDGHDHSAEGGHAEPDHATGGHAEDGHAESDHAAGDHTEGDHTESDHAASDHADPAPDENPDHAGHDHGTEAGEVDPHFWLDPVRYRNVVDGIAAKLGEIDPAHRATYEKNAAAFAAELTTLDAEFHSTLSTCTNEDLVTSHAAFGYLADRYGLHQVSVAGLEPEAEPDPARLAQVAEFVEANRITTIYAETLASPAVAQTIARETGVTMAVLDPLEGLTAESAGSDYLSVMRANLTTLTKGQGCS